MYYCKSRNRTIQEGRAPQDRLVSVSCRLRVLVRCVLCHSASKLPRSGLFAQAVLCLPTIQLKSCVSGQVIKRASVLTYSTVLACEPDRKRITAADSLSLLAKRSLANHMSAKPGPRLGEASVLRNPCVTGVRYADTNRTAPGTAALVSASRRLAHVLRTPRRSVVRIAL